MKILQIGGIIVATAITAACLAAMGKKVIDVQPSAVAELAISKELSSGHCAFGRARRIAKSRTIDLV